MDGGERIGSGVGDGERREGGGGGGVGGGVVGVFFFQAEDGIRDSDM